MDLGTALENIKKFGNKLATEEILLIRQHQEEAIPVLLKIIQNVADNPPENLENYDDFDDPAYAMFLLAEFKATAAFEPFIKILEFENETADWILGDMLYGDFGAIIASVATIKDIDRIKLVAENTNVDEHQRLTAVNALTAMYVEGVYARDDFFAYLGHLLDKFAADTTFVTFIACSCLDVYAGRHFERIRKLFQDDMIDESIIDIKHFNAAVSSGETEETSLAKLKGDSNTTFITDTVKHLSDWACFNEKKYTPAFQMSKTVVNSNKIGRNDPCPCGSGKKYKKCCLNIPGEN